MAASQASNRRLRLGRRVSIYIEPRDLWIGVYVSEQAVYVCPLPCLVIKIARSYWQTRYVPICSGGEVRMHPVARTRIRPGQPITAADISMTIKTTPRRAIIRGAPWDAAAPVDLSCPTCTSPRRDFARAIPAPSTPAAPVSTWQLCQDPWHKATPETSPPSGGGSQGGKHL